MSGGARCPIDCLLFLLFPFSLKFSLRPPCTLSISEATHYKFFPLLLLLPTRVVKEEERKKEAGDLPSFSTVRQSGDSSFAFFFLFLPVLVLLLLPCAPASASSSSVLKEEQQRNPTGEFPLGPISPRLVRSFT